MFKSLNKEEKIGVRCFEVILLYSIKQKFRITIIITVKARIEIQ